MNVTSLGENLNVIIVAGRTFAHDWMSFGLWYSINKNMPDAQVFVRFFGPPGEVDLFRWLSKCGIKIARGEVGGKILLMPPHLIMVRELNNRATDYLGQDQKPNIESISCEARGQDFAPFVDYRNGCGAFNWAEWIDKEGCPYDIAEGLMTHEATVNEVKVLQYWAQLGSIYSTISKG